MCLRKSYSCTVFFAFTFIAAMSGRAWDSYLASEPVAAIPLGTTQALPYGLSLEATYKWGLDNINEPLASSELAELAQHRPFDTDASDAARLARFIGLRREFLRGINVIGLDEPKIADSLFSLYRNRRLSIAFGGNFHIDGQLRGDASRDYGDEDLNIYDFPCSDTPSVLLPLYSPTTFALINLLAREGLHSVQRGYSGPSPTTQTSFAQWAFTNQCSEVDAALEELERITNTIAVLNEIIANLQLPTGANGLAARVGDSILEDSTLTPLQKRDMARALLFVLEGELRPRAEFTLQHRLFYKEGLEYYLTGVLPLLVYNEFMNRTAWYTRTLKRDTGEFRRITLLAGSAHFNNPAAPQLATHNYFKQIASRADGTKTESTITLDELNSIAGVWRWGSNLLLGGDSATSSEGILRGYKDTNDDGLVEESTGREILRNSQFYGGFDLFKHPLSGNRMLFSRVSNKLFELTGSDADGFPTGFTDRGTLSTRNDLLYARISDDGKWAVGYSDYGLPITKYSTSIEAKFNDTLGTFAHYRLSYPFAEHEIAPALSQAPWPNSTWVEGTGTPGSLLRAYRLDNPGMTWLADAKADPNGYAVFDLTTPLLANQNVVIQDVDKNKSSPAFTVSASLAPKFFNPRLTGYGDIQFQGYGQPRQPYDIRYTTDLGTFSGGWMRNISQTGNFFWEDSTEEDDAMFLTGVMLPQTLMGMTDYYRALPGTAGSYYPRINDRFRAGSVYELTTPSTFDPERFSFYSTGKFDYTALTLQSSYSFGYRFKEGGETSAPVNVVITVDYQALVNPPVKMSNGVALVQAPCLVLGGKHYPRYQFNCGNGAFDVCTQPHWHAFGPVFSLETPEVGITDPNSGSCGFGTVYFVPQETVPVSVNDWENFKIAHAPPL